MINMINLEFLSYPENKAKKDGWYLWAWKDKKSHQKLPFITPVLRLGGKWYRVFKWGTVEPLNPDDYIFSFVKLPDRLRND